MEKTISQFERNVSASFGYVKKDLLMINDAISSIQEKISHLSLNHATLLEEVEKLRKQINERKNITKKKVEKKKKSGKKKVKKKK